MLGAIDRLAALVETMRTLADAGHEAFAAHIERGDDELYLTDRSYIESNRSIMVTGGLA